MYEELVAELRLFETACRHCEKTSAADLAKRAADAIEELDAINQRQLLEIAVLIKQKWTPVTEALPKEAYGCLAIVWDNNPYSGDTFLNYYPEFVGYGGGSWNDYNGDEIPLDVVYWMKLPQIPEPPKEE